MINIDDNYLDAMEEWHRSMPKDRLAMERFQAEQMKKRWLGNLYADYQSMDTSRVQMRTIFIPVVYIGGFARRSNSSADN